MFDSRIGGAQSNPRGEGDVVSSERYHLTLAVDGRPVIHGWWGSEVVARAKFTTWVGDWGRAGARISLVDEEGCGRVIHSWPDAG
jgi:hypothetical protein